MIAIDTNILVYAHRSGCPQHQDAQSTVERAAADPQGWGIALPCLSEFWTVVTHPSCEGGPSTPEQAGEFLLALVETAGPAIFLPDDGFPERLLKAAIDLGVRGVRIFDLQIGLLAFEGGADELWTHDASFVQLQGLVVRDPLA